MCGGPGPKCNHCGGNSCPGSVSKATQALEFAKEANEKVQAKQREADEVYFLLIKFVFFQLLSRVRESKPEIYETKLESEEALRIAKQEFERINQTKTSLENQIEQMKLFLESERARPEDIQLRVEQILNVTIPFDEGQIRELSQNVKNLSFSKNYFRFDKKCLKLKTRIKF